MSIAATELATRIPIVWRIHAVFGLTTTPGTPATKRAKPNAWITDSRTVSTLVSRLIRRRPSAVFAAGFAKRNSQTQIRADRYGTRPTARIAPRDNPPAPTRSEEHT